MGIPDWLPDGWGSTNCWPAVDTGEAWQQWFERQLEELRKARRLDVPPARSDDGARVGEDLSGSLVQGLKMASKNGWQLGQSELNDGLWVVRHLYLLGETKLTAEDVELRIGNDRPLAALGAIKRWLFDEGEGVTSVQESSRAKPDARNVFVIHGRNSAARDAVFDFLASGIK